MKHFKILSLLIVVVAFITSCNNENNFYEEQTSTDQMSGKGLLNARADIDGDYYGAQLDGFSGATIQGFDLSTSTYEFEPNEFYYSLYEEAGGEVPVEIRIDNKAADYNSIDGLVYIIGKVSYDYLKTQKSYESRDYYEDYTILYTLNKETREIQEVGILSGDMSFPGKTIDLIGPPQPDFDDLGNAHDLTFDAAGNLFIAFKRGKIMKYDLETNQMSEFVDFNTENNMYYDERYYKAASKISGEIEGGEFYASYDQVGFTYDFDNDKLLYGSRDNRYDSEDSDHGVALLSIDPSSGAIDELFSFRRNNNRTNATNMEYVGNNVLVYSDWDSNDDLVALNIANEEFVASAMDFGYYKDLMFIYNPDIDGDGVLNEDDPFPYSNIDEMLSIGGTNFDIENQFSDEGTTMMDEVDALINRLNEKYNGSNSSALSIEFKREMAKISYYWYKSRLISRRDRVAISRAVANVSFPFYNQEPG